MSTANDTFIGEARACNYDDLPIALTVEDLTKILCLSKNTVYELLRSRRIHALNIGRKYIIPKSALINYLELA